MIANGTFRVNATRGRAWIDATEVMADLIAGAFSVFDTLGATTSSVRITFVTSTTSASSPEASGQAICVGSASEVGARIVTECGTTAVE